jgi:hypothetical protein
MSNALLQKIMPNDPGNLSREADTLIKRIQCLPNPHFGCRLATSPTCAQRRQLGSVCASELLWGVVGRWAEVHRSSSGPEACGCTGDDSPDCVSKKPAGSRFSAVVRRAQGCGRGVCRATERRGTCQEPCIEGLVEHPALRGFQAPERRGACLAPVIEELVERLGSMISIGAQTRCQLHSGCTVNINTTRDNIRSKD